MNQTLEIQAFFNKKFVLHSCVIRKMDFLFCTINEDLGFFATYSTNNNTCLNYPKIWRSLTQKQSDVTLSVATFIWDAILLLAWKFSEACLRHIFTITYSKFIPKQFYITEKHVTYVINTKIHTCFDIARQITLVCHEEEFNSTIGLVVSFLITNSNVLYYIKTSV